MTSIVGSSFGSGLQVWFLDFGKISTNFSITSTKMSVIPRFLRIKISDSNNLYSLYEYSGEAAVSDKEYLLIIFKGFCRLAEIDFDPGMPDSWPEMILSIFVIFLSVSITSMIVGNILTFLVYKLLLFCSLVLIPSAIIYVYILTQVRRDPMEVAHKERIENLRKYMTKKNVPADMYESVMR